jgi:hypothetical protein
MMASIIVTSGVSDSKRASIITWHATTTITTVQSYRHVSISRTRGIFSSCSSFQWQLQQEPHLKHVNWLLFLQNLHSLYLGMSDSLIYSCIFPLDSIVKIIYPIIYTIAATKAYLI